MAVHPHTLKPKWSVLRFLLTVLALPVEPFLCVPGPAWQFCTPRTMGLCWVAGFRSLGVQGWDVDVCFFVVRASFEALPFQALYSFHLHRRPSWAKVDFCEGACRESLLGPLLVVRSSCLGLDRTSEECASLGARCGLPGCWAAWLYLPSPSGEPGPYLWFSRLWSCTRPCSAYSLSAHHSSLNDLELQNPRSLMHCGNVEPQTLKSLTVRKLVFADEARVDAKRGLHVGDVAASNDLPNADGSTRF